MNEDIKLILESMAIQMDKLEKELDDIDNQQVNAYVSFDALKFDFQKLLERLKK